MNLVRRIFPLALRVFTALPLVVVAMQGQAQVAPTTSDCENAWTSSSASNSCGADASTGYNEITASVDTSQFRVVASNDECRVEVHCLKSDTSVLPVANDFSGSTSEVESLSNCEGTLKAGGC